ncbi:MAG: hypothetical protein UIC45_05290 [Paludibacteraceae bacterium]|nr:hypothetical protein [Paludibacteraceae bacterium]
MKKLFTLLMTLWLAIGSLFAVDFKGGEVLYLTPCDNWITNAKNNGGGKPGRYAAYFFGNGDKWIAMTAVAGETELYQVTAPAGFKQVIFCAMNPTSTGLSWNDKWNQTNDLSYDGKNNHYTVKKGTWDKGGGTWSYYCTAPTITIVSTPEFPATTVDETSTSNAKYTLECSEDKPEISIDNDAFTAVDADGTITITFAPTEAKEYTATLTIAVGEEKETIELAATGLAKDVVKDPEVLNLTAPAFTAIVEGNTTTAVATYELLNADEAEAKVEGEGFEITEQEVGKVTIQFAPTKAGEYAGTLLVLVAGETLKEVAFTATAKPSPYYAIRGSMTDWSDKNDIKLIANDDKSEYSIKEFEIASGDEFKVVYVDEENVTTWYGVSSVEKNPELGNNIGSDNIVLPAGKYDIYYKVKESKIWIQKYVAPEEPKPSLTVSTEEVVFEEVELLGEEPIVLSEIITYTIENSEDTPVIALESEVFTAVDDAETGTITIAFKPKEEGEYTANLTITLGEIVKTVAISGSAKAAEIVEPEEPKINIIVSDFERNTAEVGDETDAAIVYSLENIESAEVEIEGEYVTFEQTEVDEGFMIAVFFRPEEVGEFPGKLTITAGEVSKVIEFTFIAVEPTEPDNTITFTVQVPEGTKECWIAGTPGWAFIQMEEVEDEENLFTITVENTVLDGAQWKYASGEGWKYAEVIEGNGNRTEAEDPYDVVTAWQKLYDPDFEPIEPYYAIRGLNGDSEWKGTGDIKLEESADGSEWSALGFTVAEGESFKVIYIDENADVSGYYAGIEEGCDVGQTFDKDGNVVLPAGTYDLYFKSVSKLMYIAKKDTPTDVEDAAAELIYAVDGTIIAPAPFAIIDLSGKDVTNANGSLQGTYIVKTQNSTAKISVK